jgi:pilus assembly protein CpaF
MSEQNPFTAPPPPNLGADMSSLFQSTARHEQLWNLLFAPEIADIRINRHDRVFYFDGFSTKQLQNVFSSAQDYKDFITSLLPLTDVGFVSYEDVDIPLLEGSFTDATTQGKLKGSLIVATDILTRAEPSLVIRKQPIDIITLDTMVEQQMLNPAMRNLLVAAVQGRQNILISGGSGAGKTTLARALAQFIDPAQRVLTVEEIDELHLDDRLPNVVALTTHTKRDVNGRVVEEQSLEDLVRHALRMRPDRIVVGEVRGPEATALIKSCLSGHDGSLTTIHANNATQAAKQLITYATESPGITESIAREYVAQAFSLAVQISRVALGRRVVTEIVELDPVREGTEQRTSPLWLYDHQRQGWQQAGSPSGRLIENMQRHNTNIDVQTLFPAR